MEEFKIRKDGFNEIRKAILVRAIPLVIAATAVGLAIPVINDNDTGGVVTILPFIIPIMVGAVVFGFYNGMKRQRASFESYVLRVDDNGITREQANTPSIHVAREEVRKVQKMPNGAFVITGASALNAIIVPAQVEGAERLERLLEGIAPISFESRKGWQMGLTIPMALLVLAGMLGVYTASNKAVVALCGAFVSITLIASFVVIRKSKNIDRGTKRSTWTVLLVLASVIAVTILKLAF